MLCEAEPSQLLLTAVQTLIDWTEDVVAHITSSLYPSCHHEIPINKVTKKKYVASASAPIAVLVVGVVTLVVDTGFVNDATAFTLGKPTLLKATFSPVWNSVVVGFVTLVAEV